MNDGALEAASWLDAKIAAIAQKGSRLLDGEISKAEFEERRESLTNEKDRLTSALKGLGNSDFRKKEDPAKVYETGRSARERYEGLLLPERRELVREIISKIEIDGASIRVIYTAPYELLAKTVAITHSSKMRKNADFENLDFEKLKNRVWQAKVLYIYILPFCLTDCVRRV